MELFFYIASFFLFALLQSLFINGVHYCFKGSGIKSEVSGNTIYDGNIFYMINPKFFEKVRYKIWIKPLWGCVRCMSSFHSLITFWPVIICIFGFHYWEIGLWVFDALILVTLNWVVYKKL